MNSSIFPDVNVWLALSYGGHVHHGIARRWYEGLADSDRLFFCRLTQMGLLRLMGQAAVMGQGNELGQAACWAIYDRWQEDPAVGFMIEPLGLEVRWREWSRSTRPASGAWSDEYLLAFAQAAGLRLATLDRGLGRRAAGAIVIGG